jgi:membrane protease YdiL (CAAX protease family)
MSNGALGFWGEFFMLQVLLTYPVSGIVSYLRIRSGKPLPPKLKRYRRTLAGQAVFLFSIILAAREENVSLIAGPRPTLTAWTVAFAFLAISGLNAKRAWPKLKAERIERARLIFPEEASQMPYWAAISVMAGITEECAYRGLAFRFLTNNHGSVVLALALCIASFAIAHLAQGWRAVIAMALIAGVLHLVVYLTQTLILAVVVHAIYDLMVGTIAMPILRNLTAKSELPQVAQA